VSTPPTTRAGPPYGHRACRGSTGKHAGSGAQRHPAVDSSTAESPVAARGLCRPPCGCQKPGRGTSSRVRQRGHSPALTRHSSRGSRPPLEGQSVLPPPLATRWGRRSRDRSGRGRVAACASATCRQNPISADTRSRASQPGEVRAIHSDPETPNSASARAPNSPAVNASTGIALLTPAYAPTDTITDPPANNATTVRTPPFDGPGAANTT